MTNWTSAFCRANGINLHYLRTGSRRPPIVLLHGLSGSGACWTALARALQDECDVLMPDARGHGRSDAPREGYCYDDHADDVIALVHGLALNAPVLLGHSMGGLTAAVVASRKAVDLRGLVLVDPTFLDAQRQHEVFASDVAAQHRRLLAQDHAEIVAQLRARHPRRSDELIDALAAARLQTNLSAFDVLAPPNPDYRQLMRTIDLTTLLVIGDAGVVSLETARELQAINTNIRIERIADAGHGLPYDRPDALEAAVRSFLRSLAA